METKDRIQLNYHHQRPSTPWRVRLAFSLGAIPFVVLVMMLLQDAATGDPPNDLMEFKRYHYAAGASALLAICWLLAIVIWRRYFHGWMLLSAMAWSLSICWIDGWFIRDMRHHPAGVYYLSHWK